MIIFPLLIFLMKKKKDKDKEDDEGSKLAFYQKEYRRSVDKQARLYGLRVAFGHDDPAKDPYPYTHKVGLKNMVKCSSS
ncbi:MAG: hypothetical protein ACL7BU_11910 [Candidatus Phlomobacter fragariae]